MSNISSKVALAMKTWKTAGYRLKTNSWNVRVCLMNARHRTYVCKVVYRMKSEVGDFPTLWSRGNSFTLGRRGFLYFGKHGEVSNRTKQGIPHFREQKDSPLPRAEGFPAYIDSGSWEKALTRSRRYPPGQTNPCRSASRSRSVPSISRQVLPRNRGSRHRNPRCIIVFLFYGSCRHSGPAGHGVSSWHSTPANPHTGLNVKYKYFIHVLA